MSQYKIGSNKGAIPVSKKDKTQDNYSECYCNIN